VSAPGPLPSALAPFARLASIAYGLGVRAHGAWWSLRGSRDAGVPVISVGNVSAGGTGKSPFVRWVAEELVAAGHRPVVALRGYAPGGGPSDEAAEHRATLPAGATVAVGADRVAAIAAARAADPAIDCAVLDDGFQHRAAARRLDIVLVDATRPAIDGRLLPAGWLREPADALRRAGLVVVTRATRVDPALAALVERHHGRPPAAWTRHEWRRIERFGAGGRDMPVEAVAGKKVACVTALGNPAPFVAEATALGARVVADLRHRDHHRFTAEDAARIAAAARAKDAAVLCTGKDWAKLEPVLPSDLGVEWLVVRPAIAFLEGEATVRAAVRAAAATAA
jgi:tetraacyldisaccharide 4'-kinase